MCYPYTLGVETVYEVYVSLKNALQHYAICTVNRHSVGSV